MWSFIRYLLSYLTLSKDGLHISIRSNKGQGIEGL